MGARNFQVKNGLVVDGDVAAVNLDVSGDITLGENKKIYFDSTDTFIYADTDSSEDLHIGADGHIELEPDNDLIVKTGSTEYVRFDGSAQRVGIGTTSPESPLEVVASLDPSGSATQFTYAETLKLDVEDSDSAEGPSIRFRHGATSDHNAADYMFQVMGDDGGSVSHEYSFNYNFRKWHHTSGADGFKPVMRFKGAGDSSASGTQYGEIILTSTATAWDVYDGTHTGLEPSTYDTKVKLSGGEVSYINNGQNFGIGLTNPSSELEIVSTGTLTLGNAELEANQFRINNGGGHAQIELGGSSGAYIDLKSPFTDDYDLRIISSGTGGTIQTSGNANLGLNVGSGNVAITGGLTVSGSYNLANSDLPDLAVSDFAASAIVTETEGIGSNDDDNTLPTSAAVKDYVDNNAGGSPGGSDTQIQYNNGGSFGGSSIMTFDDTSSAEQVLFSGSSSNPLVKIVQTGGGHAFEVHDAASDSSIFTISEVGQVTIKTATPQAGGLTINDDMYVGQIKSSAFGSASSPRYTFHADSNTGMYSGGADVLKFSTGGTERVKLSSSGLQLGAANAEVTTILDEDDLSSDSATALATQQSIKAYVDANAGGGGVSLSGSTNDQLVTVTGSNAIKGESNLTLSSAGALALTGTMTMTDTASDDTTPVLIVEQNRVSDNARLANFIGNGNEVLSVRSSGRLHWELSTSGGASDEVIMTYNDTNGDERNFMMIDQGTVVISNRGPNGDVEIRANTSSIGSGGEVTVANFQDDRVILNQNVGIGTTSPDALLHVSSGTSGDAGIIIEADTDNNDEGDLPFMWFKQDGDITVHAIQATSNRLQIINNISASGGIDFALGTTNNTGTTDPSTGTTTALSIESDGGVQARKTVIKTVSTNTTLADEDSGKTIYWTGGTLTLPATAQSGQQFVVINNKGSSATPGLGTSNAIQTGWTAHAAMADETARTYISVAANKWIYIG